MADLKKNSKNLNTYINLAFEQAKINLGSTKTNPSVGCIIERNGAIISSGSTSLNGRPHAEFNALNNKLNYKDTNLIVTMEPCTHTGQTPPCTNLIKKKKIKKVFFSVFDADKRTKKKCFNVLKNNNIKVYSQCKKKNAVNFYKSYFLYHSNNLPLIDAKIALSKDYFTKNKNEKFITNNRSRKTSHLIRSTYDCIISTSKTINEDNSLLNCRIEGLEQKTPDLIIIDRYLKIKKNLDLFKKKIKRKIIIFTTRKNAEKITFLKKKNIKVYIIDSLSTQKDFRNVFFALKKLKYTRIFIESGLTLLNLLLRYNFINNIYFFKTPTKINKLGINYSSVDLLKKFKLKNKINVNLMGDYLYKERIK